MLLPGHDDPALDFLALNTWVDLRDGLSDRAALERLIAAIRGELPGGPVRDPRAEICPYRGLQPFREEDAQFFFGREGVTAHLLERVAEERFVAVLGASGSGKSSVVRAGLVPALRRSAGACWEVLTLVPTANPLHALVQAFDPPAPELGLIERVHRLNGGAERLRDGGVGLGALTEALLGQQSGTDRLLLIVDQFEELYTLAQRSDEIAPNETVRSARATRSTEVAVEDRARFIDLLLEASEGEGRLHIVLTLRGDFYARALERRKLSDRLEGAVFNVGPLQRESEAQGELEAVIRKPAEALGLGFEEGLVERILGDVGAEPGNLPLLEFLLRELWTRREHGLLTHAAYTDLGGVRGAIAARADAVFEALGPAEREAAKRLFLMLVEPGEGQEDTRTRARIAEDETTGRIVERFARGDTRLLVTSEDPVLGRAVEVSHEALIREWRVYRRWIETNRDRLRARARVKERMERWEAEGKAAGLLLPTGLDLEEGRALLADAGDVSVEDLRGYVEASGRQETRGARRRQLGYSAILMVLTVFSVFAVSQWRQANIERARAVEAEAGAIEAKAEAIEQRDVATSRYLATQARQVLENNTGEVSVAAMIAVDSLSRRATEEGRGVLRDTLRLSEVGAKLAPTPWAYSDVSVSGDGRIAAFTRAAGSEEVGPVRSEVFQLGMELQTLGSVELEGHAEPGFDPRGRWIVVGGSTWQLIVRDRHSGADLLNVATRGDVHPVFSPDGGTLYAVIQTGPIRRFDTDTWQELEPFGFPVDGAGRDLDVGITSDGRYILVAERARTVHVINTSDGVVRTLPVQPDDVATWFRSRHPLGAVMAPDGPRALIYDNRGGNALWDLERGEMLWSRDDGWEARVSRSEAVVFSANGARLAKGGVEGLIVLSDASDGRELARFDHGGKIRMLAFLDDGKLLVAAGENGASFWNTTAPAQPRRCEEGRDVLALARQGGAVLLGLYNGRIVRCDARTGKVLASRHLHAAIRALSVSGPEILASISASDIAQNWTEISFVNRESKREISRIVENGFLWGTVVLSRDGARAAAQRRFDGQIMVWDTSTRATLSTFASEASLLGFSPDGLRLRLRVRGNFGAIFTRNIASGAVSPQMGEKGGVRRLFGTPHSATAVTAGENDAGELEFRGWDLVSLEETWSLTEATDMSSDGEVYFRWNDDRTRADVFRRQGGVSIGRIDLQGQPVIFLLSERGTRAISSEQILEADEPVYVTKLWDVAGGTTLWTHRQEETSLPPSIWIGSTHFVVSSRVFGEDPHQIVEIRRWSDGWLAGRMQRSTGSSLQVAFETEEEHVLLSSDGVTLIDLQHGSTLWRDPESTFDYADFLPGGRHVATARGAQVEVRSRIDGSVLQSWDTGSNIGALVATADGHGLIAAFDSDDWSGIRLYKATTGEVIQEIEMEDAIPHELLALPDPDHVAVRDWSSGFRVFDLANGREIKRFAHATVTETSHFAEDALRAATASGASLRVWDTVSGMELAHRIAEGEILSADISPDGSSVVIRTSRSRIGADGASSQSLDIWKPDENAPAVSIAVEDVGAVDYDPTGRWLILRGTGEKTTVRVVDAVSLLTRLTVPPLAKGKILDAVMTGDGAFLLVSEGARYGEPALGGQRNSIRVFRMADGAELARIDVASYTGAAAFAMNGVYFKGHDSRLRWVELPPPDFEQIVDSKEGTWEILAVPESERVLLDGTLLLDLSSGENIALAGAQSDFRVTSAAIDQSGQYLARALVLDRYSGAGTLEAFVIVTELKSGRELARLDDLPLVPRKIDFLANDKTLLLAEWDNVFLEKPDDTGSVWLLDWRTGAVTLLDPTVVAAGTTLSGDGEIIATDEGIYDTGKNVEHSPRRVRLWRRQGGKPLLRRPNVYDGARVLLSGNGKRVAIFSVSSPTIGEVLEVRDHAPPKQILELKHEDEFQWARPAAFIGDGRTLVVEDASGVRLFELENGAQRHLPEAGTRKDVAISPDEHLLAMGGRDFFSVWDIATGERLVRIEVDDLRDLVFVGDRLVLLTGRGVEIPLWRSEELIARACEEFEGSQWLQGRARVTGTREESRCEMKIIGR